MLNYVSVKYLLDSVKRVSRRYFKMRNSSVKSVGVTLSSAYDEYYPNRRPHNVLRVHFCQERYLEIILPNFLKHSVIELPNGKKVTYNNEYGFKFTADGMTSRFGPQTYGSRKEHDRVKLFVYPWTETRTTMLGVIDFGKTPPEGECFYRKDGNDFFQKHIKAKNSIVGHTFVVRDYDGETANAKAIVELHGTASGFWGKYSFLFFLRRVRIERTLIVTFDKYLGNQKHTFKGGSSSISLVMEKNETYIEALNRLFANPHACSTEFTHLQRLEPVKEAYHEQTY